MKSLLLPLPLPNLKGYKSHLALMLRFQSPELDLSVPRQAIQDAMKRDERVGKPIARHAPADFLSCDEGHVCEEGERSGTQSCGTEREKEKDQVNARIARLLLKKETKPREKKWHGRREDNGEAMMKLRQKNKETKSCLLIDKSLGDVGDLHKGVQPYRISRLK